MENGYTGKKIANKHINGQIKLPRNIKTTIGYGAKNCHGELITLGFQSFLQKSILHKNFVKWLGESAKKDTILLQNKINLEMILISKKAIKAQSPNICEQMDQWRYYQCMYGEKETMKPC